MNKRVHSKKRETLITILYKKKTKDIVQIIGTVKY